MKRFLELLKQELPLTATSVGGFFVGEKVWRLAAEARFVFLASDFVSASKIKRGLKAVGLDVDIVSCGREIEDEHDANLFPFARCVTKFLGGALNGLIFLPSSMTTKFDVEFLKQKLTLSVGQEITIEDLSKCLVEFGFERVDYLTSQGQFSVRGDCFDIFFDEFPTRIEFFDEEIEKIVNFEFSTMKTLKNLEKIEIFPYFLKNGEDSVLNLCGEIFVDEPSKIENECKILQTSRQQLSWVKEGMFLNFAEIDLKRCVVFSNLQKCEFENKTLGQKSYVTDFLSLKNDLQIFSSGHLKVFLFGGEFSEILVEFLVTNKVAFRFFDGKIEEEISVYVVREFFPYSFSFLEAGIVGIGTDDMYKSRRVDVRGRQNFSYLPKVGDFVVHSFYGVGRCTDIVRMKLSHFEKDYFVLEYRNGALLYLPTEQANLLSAYVGGEAPRLNALGSSEWNKTKQKVKENLKEIARELAVVYKQRQTRKGFKFERDNSLEEQFADEFEFVLTADQAQAIVDVDADMESDKIMDRLICGDVGFGKTEVAFRAMFKAAYNSKQVAFLCPTTILSEQHFRSTKQRMEKFGLHVEVLNRFKSEKETAQICQRLYEGKIDILVGTHKMLGEKVKFKDLGLLVLDEEQRFGVKDKEKIKNIKSDIDVLTLSATPIPRTLHMSLSGIRDISVIATAPRDRLPIQTYVSAYSDELLQEVTRREMSRNGKTLILYNKVADIEAFRAHVCELLPDATVGVTHGQMEEKQLLRVINDLYDDKFNVLISTTLIENGIDFPTLNTLFVVDCDMFGLGQLYQIRGRIGRSDKLAYAYLTFNGGKVLTEEACKRLDAIKEFRELGSGFKIAMRDLEIRGAGNLLGKEQHGHMEKVGYDMYVRLLDEVTKEMAGEKVGKEKEIKLELVLDAYILEDYVASQEERIIFYDKISKIESKETFDMVVKELEECNGPLPKETENLCKIAYLKNLAGQFNVQKIKINDRDCLLYLYKSEEIIDKRLSKVGKFYDACLKFEETPILKVNTTGKVVDKVDLLIAMFESAAKNL